MLLFTRCADARSVFFAGSKHVIIFHLARSCSASYFTALRAASTLVDIERLIIYSKGASERNGGEFFPFDLSGKRPEEVGDIVLPIE